MTDPDVQRTLTVIEQRLAGAAPMPDDVPGQTILDVDPPGPEQERLSW